MKRLLWTCAVVTGTAALVAPVAPASGAAPAPTRCAVTARELTLGTGDNGRTICVHRGQRLDVALTVEPVEGTVPAQWWQPVGLTGSGLSAVPNTLMPVRGTTLAHFQVTARGTAGLSSRRHPCAPAPPGGASCALIQAWSVTVTIR